MKKIVNNRIKSLKYRASVVKSTALLRLFGIKPRNNSLHFRRIEVKEREISPELFNSWSQSTFK